MEMKPEKDRKLKSGCYVECIAKGCSKPPNVGGLCWDHYGIQREEEGRNEREDY